MCSDLAARAEPAEAPIDEFAPGSPGAVDETMQPAEELPVDEVAPEEELEADREPIAPEGAAAGGEDYVPYETLTKKTVEMVRYLGVQFASGDTDSLSFNGLVGVRAPPVGYCTVGSCTY